MSTDQNANADTTTAEREQFTMPPVSEAVPPVVYDGPVKRRPAVLDWDQEYQRLVKLTVLRPKNREATGAELAMFAEQVQRSGLDPFFKQIYGIYRWDTRANDEVMQVQAGIDGFRLVAERTGKYEGQTPAQWCGRDGVWCDVWTQGGHPFAARIGVYKKGRREPTYAVAHWTEYAQSAGKWKDMPANMLAKCAEALALRKCFPAELSGLYTPDEWGTDDRVGGDLTATDSTAVEVVELLPPAVEAVLSRAIALGHRGVGNRATAAMAVRDQPPEVVEAKVHAWTVELDRMEAEVRKRPLSENSAKVGEDTPEGDAAPDAPATASEAGESAESVADVARDAGSHDSVGGIEAAIQDRLDGADAADVEGDTELAERLRGDAGELMDRLDAIRPGPHDGEGIEL